MANERETPWYTGVCFDAFGTLLEITDRRDPYRGFLRALPSTARQEFKRRLLREDRSTSDWSAALEAGIREGVLAQVETEIRIEIASIRMRSGLRTVWTALRAHGLKLAICSNLAAPYGPPLRAVLPNAPDAFTLSYELGAVKPEPAVYTAVARMLALPPDRILFVGDSRAADIEGPRRAGMGAMHVTDFEAMNIGAELPRSLHGQGILWRPQASNDDAKD